jgi:hypothetical protein
MGSARRRPITLIRVEGGKRRRPSSKWRLELVLGTAAASREPLARIGFGCRQLVQGEVTMASRSIWCLVTGRGADSAIFPPPPGGISASVPRGGATGRKKLPLPVSRPLSRELTLFLSLLIAFLHACAWRRDPHGNWAVRSIGAPPNTSPNPALHLSSHQSPKRHETLA